MSTTVTIDGIRYSVSAPVYDGGTYLLTGHAPRIDAISQGTHTQTTIQLEYDPGTRELLCCANVVRKATDTEHAAITA